MTFNRLNRLMFTILAMLGLVSLAGPVAGQPDAAARYSPATGSVYLYLTDGIGVAGLGLDEGLFDFTAGLPMLGDIPASGAAADVAYFADANGLPAGLYHLGRILPEGLPADYAMDFGYTPIAAPAVDGSPETFVAEAVASAVYDPTTGELTVAIGSGAAALLLQSEGQFQSAANPRINSLTPAFFDADSLMFFAGGQPLPEGEFRLGAVLPPGLSAAELKLATKGDGIATDLPVAIIPEPCSVLIAAAALLLCCGRRPGGFSPAIS